MDKKYTLELDVTQVCTIDSSLDTRFDWANGVLASNQISPTLRKILEGEKNDILKLKELIKSLLSDGNER